MQAITKSPLGVGGSGVSVSGLGGGVSPIASRHSDVNTDIGSGSAASVSIGPLDTSTSTISANNSLANPFSGPDDHDAVRDPCHDIKHVLNDDISMSKRQKLSFNNFVQRHELQSKSNGVSNLCLDRAANVLPDSPPVSTVAALARITNTVAHDESFASKRRRLQHSHGVSGPGPLSFSTPTHFLQRPRSGFQF